MSAIAGYGGSVTNGGTDVREWSANLQVAVLDVTDFDSSGNEEVIRGLKGCDGSLTCYSAPPTVGSTDTLTLNCGAGGISYSGTALFTSVQPRVAVDGKVEYTVNFKYTGSVTVGAGS